MLYLLCVSGHQSSMQLYSVLDFRRQRGHGTYLVNLLLGMREEPGEVLESAAVEHDLCLVVGARHDVTHRSQRCSLHT